MVELHHHHLAAVLGSDLAAMKREAGVVDGMKAKGRLAEEVEV